MYIAEKKTRLQHAEYNLLDGMPDLLLLTVGVETDVEKTEYILSIKMSELSEFVMFAFY